MAPPANETEIGAFFREVESGFPGGFLSREKSELEIFGRDWTKVFAPNPSAIAFPRSTDEVSRFLKLCSKHRVAVVPSGGRTGLAGGAVAARGEVVLSLSRMNRIDAVDPLAQTVRVQAGAVTEAVHKHCEPHGLTWPVDFASKGSSHVGGNIATNAGGVKVIRYGVARQWVLGLEVVTMDGTVLELNGALEKNNTGLDLRQLFIGSEGTLGVITEATLKLSRLPGELDVFFFAVPDMAGVLALFQEARRAPFDLMAFEMLTDACLDGVMQVRGLKSPFTQAYTHYVLMEVERPASESARELLDGWLSSLFEKGLALDGTLAQSPREARELWQLREGISESISRLGIPHKNDIALPISRLESFVAGMEKLFRERHDGFKMFLFGHVGDGNLHVNTLKPDAMPMDGFLKRCHDADEALFRLVQKHQGSVSAEHGIGLLKKDALRFSRAPAEIALLKRIKDALDPAGLLNPGKILD